MQFVADLSGVRVAVPGRAVLDVGYDEARTRGVGVGVGAGFGTRLPAQLEDEVARAVVDERGVEVEAEPLVGAGGDIGPGAVENLGRRGAGVVVGVGRREGGSRGVAELEREVVEAAGSEYVGEEPLPFRNRTRGYGVGL